MAADFKNVFYELNAILAILIDCLLTYLILLII